jgi:transketolase
MESKMKTNELKKDAAKIRLGILKSMSKIKAGHIGGSMSMADIMATLYGEVMSVKPDEPKWEGRDYLVVSKGHCGPAVYATLAVKGFFPYEELETMNQGGTNLPSHCDKNKTPGIDMTTGSLGQGISTAIGIATGLKLLGKNNRVFLIVGDGEIQEGQAWEGFLFANQRKLSNLFLIVDDNEKQLDGYTKDICEVENISEKLKAFGFETFDCDGNSVASLLETFARASEVDGTPKAIVCKTEKGKGCSFAEGVLYNHHMAFTEEQLLKAEERLNGELNELQN